MTTTNTRYVDPNAQVGGDGTTNALTGANCAYVSLAVWEAARQADLPSGDIIEKVICSSDDAGSTHVADSTIFTIDGWTTDATRYIQIEAATSHGGKWNAGIYRLDATGNSNGQIIRQQEDCVRYTGIQIKGSKGANSHVSALKIVATGAAGDTQIRKCIIRGDSLDDPLIYWVNNNAGADCLVENSLLYDGTGTGILSNAGTMTVYNCTLHNVHNCLVQGGGTFNATNCGLLYTSAATSGTVGLTTCSSSSPTFVDEANDDFHLASGDTTWKNQGTDLSANFTDDIDGDTRSLWSIGVDDGPAAAAGNPYYYYAQL